MVSEVMNNIYNFIHLIRIHKFFSISGHHSSRNYYIEKKTTSKQLNKNPQTDL